MADLHVLHKRLDCIEDKIQMVLHNFSMDRYDMKNLETSLYERASKETLVDNYASPAFITSSFEKLFDKLEEIEFRLQKIEKHVYIK